MRKLLTLIAFLMLEAPQIHDVHISTCVIVVPHVVCPPPPPNFCLNSIGQKSRKSA